MNDKFQESFDGTKEGIRVSKSAYFTGVLKNLAQEQGLQLGLGSVHESKTIVDSRREVKR